MPQLQKYRRRKKISQTKLALMIGVERGIISMIECYKVLPTPETMLKIEQILKLDRMQIFEKEEIRLLKKQRNKHTIPEDYPHFHIHIVLPRNFKILFSKEILQLAGYENIHHWFMNKVNQYVKQLECIIEHKKEKDPNWHPQDDLKVLFKSASTFDYKVPKKREKVK